MADASVFLPHVIANKEKGQWAFYEFPANLLTAFSLIANVFNRGSSPAARNSVTGAMANLQRPGEPQMPRSLSQRAQVIGQGLYLLFIQVDLGHHALRENVGWVSEQAHKQIPIIFASYMS